MDSVTASSPYEAKYEGESNGNIKRAITIRTTARLSCELTAVILVGGRVVDRLQYVTT